TERRSTREQTHMRMMLKVQVPVEAGNEGVRSGALVGMIDQVNAQLQPEAAYFFTENGMRTFILVFDLADPSQIPVVAEPFFQNANAGVTFIPVMNADDLRAGLELLAAAG